MTAILAPNAALCRKGRPRDERIDREITKTALEVLADVGFAEFSIAEVVDRTGVAKTTVYRRFATRELLIESALGRLNDGLPLEPPTGEFRPLLVDAVAGILRQTPESLDARVFAHAMSEATRDPNIARLVREHVVTPRRARLREILRRGVDSGELRGDTDLDTALVCVIGPALFLARAKGAGDLREFGAEQLVEQVLVGLASR